MTPLPWPLIGWYREPQLHPIVQAARQHLGVRYVPTSPRPAQPPRPSAARTDYEATAAGWTAREAAVLDRLAEAGGDHAAHRAVHLEDR